LYTGRCGFVSVFSVQCDGVYVELSLCCVHAYELYFAEMVW